MGLLQQAVMTYDANLDRVGVIESPDQDPLVPVSHILAKATIEVAITEKGEFYSAQLLEKDEQKIIIPVTEESGGRSGKYPPPHPLCDKVEYLAPGNEIKHRAYVEQLSEWTNSDHGHPMLYPILKYVQGGSLIDDLYSVPDLEEKSIDEINKLFVRWRVVGLGDSSGECWNCGSLFDSFIEWYSEKLELQPQNICMIEGEIEAISENHPKGIFPLHGNAKLISANDTSGFTYRGRFLDNTQAATIGYFSSQKAHNALRWIIGKQRVWYGGRAFICWSVQMNELPQPTGLFSVDITPAVTLVDYGKELKKTLEGYMVKLPTEAEGVALAVLDAATPGRLSIVYYNELMASDYLERLRKWDYSCAWFNGKFGIRTPLLRNIVNYAFGSLRDDKGQSRFVTDSKVMSNQMQRLVRCRVDGAMLPLDFMQVLVDRASNLKIYDRNLALNLLFTACAVIRKYHIDVLGEDIGMALDENKEDCSYQYGRLLAVLEKIETDTYDPEETREPNALRHQTAFRYNPLRVGALVHGKVNDAYFPRLKVKNQRRYYFYKNEIGQIIEKLNDFPQSELKKPLKETYLIGYYLERNKLWHINKSSGDNSTSENE